MFGAFARITVTINSKDPKFDSSEYFDSFKEHINELKSNCGNMFKLVRIEADGKATAPTPSNQDVSKDIQELATKDVYYRSKNISDTDEFIDVCRALKLWYNEKKMDFNRISIEIVLPSLKFPLYLRKNKLMPPDTFYHLKMISKDNQSFIDMVNQTIYPEEFPKRGDGVAKCSV